MKRLFSALLAFTLILASPSWAIRHARGGVIPSTGGSITSTSPLTSGATGIAYSNTLTTSGLTPPITWSILSGTPPAGLSLGGSTGILSGTPSTAGSSTFTVQAADSGSQAPTKLFTLAISGGLAISTGSTLSPATTGSSYSTTLNASGGASPYTWSFTAAPSPNTGSWLTLNGSTGVLGTSSTNYPGTAETETMTVRVTDANGTQVTKGFTLQVNVPATGHAQGMVLQVPTYATGEQPFMNIFHGSDNESGDEFHYTGWQTSPAGKEGALQLDADGYPTSFTGNYGQSVTQVYAIMKNSVASNPNGTAYPAGLYHLAATGNCDITITGDVTTSVHRPSPGNGAPTAQTFTVNTGNGNLNLNINAIGGGTGQNYCTNIQVVRDRDWTAFQGGAIFTPEFIAALTGTSAVRFMDWKQLSVNQYMTFGYKAPAATAGATSYTMYSCDDSGNCTARPWNRPSGTWPVYFVGTGSNTQAELRTANMTYGSSTITWTGGLSIAHQDISIDMACGNGSCATGSTVAWDNRSKPSNAFWTQQDGVPLEICLALANQLGADPWYNFPLTINDAYIHLADAAIKTGAGLQSGFSGIASGLKAREELGNEIWNTAATQYAVSSALGYMQWPTSGLNQNDSALQYFGMRNAVLSELAYADWAGSSQLVWTLGSFAYNTYYTGEELNPSAWKSPIDGYSPPAYAHHINAVAIAPYFGNNLSPSDVAHMSALTPASAQLNDFFCVMYSNNCNGYTYSMASNGYIGSATTTWMTNNVTYLSGGCSGNCPGNTLKLVGYEGGANFLLGGYTTFQATIVAAAKADPRWKTDYLDYFNKWGTIVGQTRDNVFLQYNDFSNNFGCATNVYQTLGTVPCWDAYLTRLGISH
jgi:hypothetical protein